MTKKKATVARGTKTPPRMKEAKPKVTKLGRLSDWSWHWRSLIHSTRELLDGRRQVSGGLIELLRRGIPHDWQQQRVLFQTQSA